MDKKIEKDIINCSRCGLCMDVCPVYKVKKSETSVSRGKFLQLLGLIRKELKFDKKIAYNLDLCLGCKKCKSACPSGIDAVEVFASVKNEFQTPLDKVLNSMLFFKVKIFMLRLFYRIKYPLGRYKKSDKKIIGENVAYFKGCATKAFSMGLDEFFGFKKEKFFCCGLPYFVKGRLNLYEKCKKRNIKLIKKYDKVIFDCATCYDTVKNYKELTPQDKSKLIYFTEFESLKKFVPKVPLKVTFHKPCHLPYETFEKIEKLLSDIENVEYVRMDGFDECCGFSGDFFVRHPKTAYALSDEKYKNIIKTGADVVLTTCPTCLWSLKFGINKNGSKLKAYDLQEFLYYKLK